MLLPLLTIDGQLGFVGIIGAEVIGDDALILSLISEIHIGEVQDCGILYHLSTLLLVPGKILHLCIIQYFTVFAPGSGHGRITAAHSSACQGHVHASQSHGGLGMHSDLWLREII